ncbi:MAG: hypothetical protein PHU12_01550 [Candidatus Aenigmarchaeota archaeon]|nr:hypothetical protein [Candidatus Aenigmarchaeota archaeon]
MLEKKIDPNRDWKLDEEDLQRARKILKGEVLNKNYINRIGAYDALVYSQLSHRQYYTTQVRTFVTLKEKGLTDPKNVISRNQEVEDVIRRHGSVFRQKARYLANSAKFWIETNYPERLIDDVNNGREKCDELRDEIINGVTGIGYKLASLFFLKLGYQTVSIDTWLIEYLAHTKIADRLDIDVSKGSVPANKYKQAENELRKVAGEYNITLPELCAAAWSKYSTWNEDDMRIYLKAISK